MNQVPVSWFRTGGTGRLVRDHQRCAGHIYYNLAPGRDSVRELIPAQHINKQTTPSALRGHSGLNMNIRITLRTNVNLLIQIVLEVLRAGMLISSLRFFILVQNWQYIGSCLNISLSLLSGLNLNINKLNSSNHQLAYKDIHRKDSECAQDKLRSNIQRKAQV